MAITSFPFDSQVVTESQYGYLFREFQDSGVVAAYDSPGFQVSAGNGMVVNVQPGLAILRGHMVQSTAAEALTIPAAGTSTRVDRVVLRLDPASNSITLAVKAGSVGSSAPPALSQTDTGIYEMALANVTVAANVTTITSADVSATRPVVGHRVGVWATATRPSSPRKGQLGFNNSLARWEWWDGSTWADLAPTVSWASLTGKPSSFAPSAHSHAWGDITEKPTTFPAAEHSHNWDSVVGKPSYFPPTSHGHSWGQISDKPGSYPPSGHSHGEYLTSGSTISWANGSKMPHNNSASGSGTWYAVWVEGDGTFCRNTSSIRYKENVRDIEVDPAAVLALRPRIYDRKPTEDKPQSRKDEYGLIAEEVAATLPEIVTYDEEGRIDALRYDLLGVALLPVVQDQAKRIGRLEALVEELARAA
ncbi:tail fiber domain-containing protein [Streptomyces chattanoogensis]|uniref:tail fiber domain-containing protein n=1 Tax=Streptomyces chattanoogensis TaxID=66876 RepID=UPI0036AC455A